MSDKIKIKRMGWQQRINLRDYGFRVECQCLDGDKDVLNQEECAKDTGCIRIAEIIEKEQDGRG